MTSQRIALAAAGVLSATALVLTGCGGGGSSDNSALVDQLMQEIGSDMDDATKTCIRDELNTYSTEDLEFLANSESDAQIPKELEDKVVNMMMTCLGDTN